MPGSSRMRRLVSLILWAAIAYFFFVVVRQLDWTVVATQRINWLLAFVVVVAGVGNRFLLPVLWTIALSSLEGKPLRLRVLIWPYAESWMARYLPGKVGLIGSRVLAASRYGYSRVNAIISGAVEVVLQVIFVTVLSLVFLSLGLRSQLPFNAVPVIGVAAVLAALVSPPALRRLVELYLRWQKNAEPSTSYLSWRAVLGCVLVLVVMYAVQSGYTILMAESIGMPAHEQWLVFLGSIFLSSIAGMVAFFSPGGLGVRELVFVQVLGAWFAKEQLVSFVVFWRLVETLNDVLFVLVAWWISVDTRRQSARL